MKERGGKVRIGTIVIACIAISAVAAIVAMRPPRTIESSQRPRASDHGKPPSSRAVAAANHAPRISLSKMPLSFEPNLGQSYPSAKFLSRGQGYTLFLTAREAVLSMRDAAPREAGGLHGAIGGPSSTFFDRGKTVGNGLRAKLQPPSLLPAGGAKEALGKVGQPAVVRIGLKGAARAPQIIGVDRMAARSNYFIGNDPKKWRTDVPNYAKVELKDVYPGIDLIYHGSAQGQLEYDFRLAPGADPNAIRLSFRGAGKLALDKQGDLIVSVGKSKLVEHAPAIYQESGGARRTIGGGWRLHGAHEAGMQVAAYDRSRPIVIDPILTFSTYLGGSGPDGALAVAADASRNAYVTGFACSPNFPVTVGSENTGCDAFITKFNSSGALVYSTFIGGSSFDEGRGIAVDSTGAVYVAGETFSSDFPFTVGQSFAGLSDAFVAKLSPAGSSVVYARLFGGSTSTDAALGVGGSVATAVAIPAGCSSNCNAFVTGQTTTSDFPVTGGAFQSSAPNIFNAIVVGVSADGSQVLYSTYYSGGPGPNNDDSGLFAASIAVDGSSDAFITGIADVATLPTTVGGAYNGGADCFVAEFNNSGTNLIFARYLGGIGYDEGLGIALEPSCQSNCNSYVAGLTWSTDFPTTSGAFQTTFGGYDDGFVTKLNASGSIVYSTYLGDAGADAAEAISVDSSGSAYVTGFTNFINFPQVNALQGPSAPFFQLFKATDGATFNSTAQSTMASALLNISIDPVNTSTIYVGTNRSGILKSTDGGASFNPTGLTGQPAGPIVDLNNHTTVYAATANGLLKSVDGGATFSATALTGQSVRSFAQDPSTSPTTIYAGTQLSGVMKSTDAGASFQVVPTLPNTEVLSLLVDPQSPANLYAGTGNGLFRTSNFHATGSMNVARQFFPLDLLSDGTVLACGGDTATNYTVPTASAEIFNPSAGSWTATGNMVTARAFHTGTTLEDGTVLVTGGIDSGGDVLVSAELFSAGTFAATGTMTTPRVDDTATLLQNGDVLVAGGDFFVGGTAELYDPTTKTFTLTAGNMTMFRAYQTATLLMNGNVLIAGGVTSSNTATATAELYDPTTETFSATGSMANARHAHTATLLPDGKVLITGGTTNTSDDAMGDIASAELYDPSLGTFSSVGNMTIARADHGAVLLANGLALVAGGFSPTATAFTAADLYNPATATFSPTTLMNALHIGGGGSPPAPAILLNNGMVLWAGGQLGFSNPRNRFPSFTIPITTPSCGR